MQIGPYEVVGELGRGGMGAVLRGRAPDGREVAIKVLHQARRDALERFDRERRLHADLGQVHGFVPFLDAGAGPPPYLVMPLLAGGTLRERLDRERLGVGASLILVRTLAAALGRAHRLGVVHRDLKPENILFTADGAPLVADLGLAKHFWFGAEQSVVLSRTGETRGSVGYMAPEQVRDSRNVGPPADVFALGAILYECLSGEPAFGDASPVEVMARIMKGDREPLRKACPGAPVWLVDEVDRALAIDPAERHHDCEALARALARGPVGRRSRRALPIIVLALLALCGIGVAAASFLRAAPVTPRPTGWRDEPLVPGLRRGAASPVLIWTAASGLELELVWIPPGPFLMGSDAVEAADGERPARTVRLERGAWLGRHLVTWGEYQAFCAATGRPRHRSQMLDLISEPRDPHPVVNVELTDATAFCAWAGLRLPDEVEWEKAARGEDGRRWPWGDAWDAARCNSCDASHPGKNMYQGKTVDELGLRDPSAWDGFPYTSPAGAFPAGASPYGALDMAGNVWQWVLAPADPSAPHGAVTRGGSLSDPKHDLQSWRRETSAGGGNCVGFRVALGPGP